MFKVHDETSCDDFGFGVNILIVYVGSWDEGGMKETVFFLRREMHYENTC